MPGLNFVSDCLPTISAVCAMAGTTRRLDYTE
jgi:hypothetical protein